LSTTTKCALVPVAKHRPYDFLRRTLKARRTSLESPYVFQKHAWTFWVGARCCFGFASNDAKKLSLRRWGGRAPRPVDVRRPAHGPAEILKTGRFQYFSTGKRTKATTIQNAAWPRGPPNASGVFASCRVRERQLQRWPRSPTPSQIQPCGQMVGT